VIASLHPGDTVQGEIYKLRRIKQTLMLLDEYEECSANYPQPTEYIRCQRTVKWDDGSNRPVWIYLYNRPTQLLPHIDSGDFCK